MTVFTTPLATLPNGGIIRRPDLEAPDHRMALAGIAALDDAAEREARATAWAHSAHAAENAQLQHTAEQVLGTLAGAEAATRTDLDRHREAMAAEADITAVVSAERVVTRDRVAWFKAVLACTLLVAAYIATEVALLGATVMTSGVLGLLPDVGADRFAAYAFAGAPVFFAAVKYAWHQRLRTTAERDAYLRHLKRLGTVIGIPAWTIAFIFLFGPSLVPEAGALDDPFAERPALALAISGFVQETQRILKDLSGLMPLLLLAGILYCASNLIAVIWISHRETAAAALREHVRPAERHAFRAGARDGLIADQIQTDASIGRLSGLIAQIAADRDVFAGLSCGRVEAARAKGELAMRNALLAEVEEGRVINAAPLFSRR